MNKAKLKELTLGQKRRFLDKKGLVRRSVQETAAKFLDVRESVVITGVRRCGKSSLLRLICSDIMEKFSIPESDIIYLNFEDERFINFTPDDFEKIDELSLELGSEKGRRYYFLDEIQNVQAWERWLNRLYEFDQARVFVTGSNASLLDTDISKALTGRNRQLLLHPLSFTEYLLFNRLKVSEQMFAVPEEKALVKKRFETYLAMGGFPEVAKTGDTTLLEQYFKDILYRDVIAKHSIRNGKEIKELVLFLASNIGTIRSYQNLQEMIGARSRVSIKNYLNILEQVFLFFGVDKFDFSVKKQIYNPSKIYSIDTALSNTMAFSMSANTGKIFENAVFVELLRRGKEIYYWRSARDKEIDFVIRKGRSIESAIQVCADISKKETFEREMSALMEAKAELNPKSCLLITADEEGAKDGVEIMPLWKWMLN